MKMLGIDCNSCHSTGTIIHIALNGEYAGHIVISDIEKPNSKKAVSALKKRELIKRLCLREMQKVAEKVAADIGIDEVHSELLPAIRFRRLKG